jgi:hypothetical protein
LNARIALPAAVVLALAGACAAPSSDAPASAAGHGDLHEQGEKAGIHNLAEVAPGILRGAQPEGDASFALLASLGVKTALSVDGAQPDVEGAAKHGIRYVHIPIGYSGLTREEQVKIGKVSKEAGGALFVHCHHGKHRGPAASGVAWMARDGSDPKLAVADMKKAGTDPKYEGLYADVLGFRPIAAEEYAKIRPEDLPSAAPVPDFIEAMVRVDDTFERVKAIRSAGWKTPAAMPDVMPAHEVRILAEHLRETARLEEVKARPQDFRDWLASGEKAAWALEEAIRAGGGDAAQTAFEAVNTSCNSCHTAYRNKRPSR